MNLFLFLAIFMFVLIFGKPENTSLRDTSELTPVQMISQVKATLCLGVIMIVVFYLGSDGKMWKSTEQFMETFGMSKGLDYKLYQLVTSIFAHLDALHLVSNLVVFMLLSAYERKHGTWRFLAVFFVSGIFASDVGYVLTPPDLYHLGASGAICGLAAAYYSDYDGLTVGDTIKAFLLILFLVAFLSLFGSARGAGANIDHLAHLSGAAGGFIFCRIFRKEVVQVRAKAEPA